MRETIFTLIIAAVLTLTACVPSLHPFYSNGDIFFDRNLLGTWTDREGSEQWQFAEGEELSYSVKYTDRSGKTGRFTAHLFKIDNRTYMDVSPVRADPEDSELYVEQILPTHTLMSVKMEAGSVQLAFLDPTWLKSYLKRNPREIDHTFMDDGIVLTATTARLQAFVRRHINTQGAFEDTETMIRKGDK